MTNLKPFDDEGFYSGKSPVKTQKALPQFWKDAEEEAGKDFGLETSKIVNSLYMDPVNFIQYVHVDGELLSLLLCSSLCSFSVCLSISYLFSSYFYLCSVLNLFFHVTAPRQSEFCPWQNLLLPQVLSPISLTTSTTRRLPKSSSKSNPATNTRCPRTSVTRNSTMRPSEEGLSSNCYCSFRSDAELDDETIGMALSSSRSFRSEKNQRTEDTLITPLKKVRCQLSPCQSAMQERGDPCMNLVR